MKWTVGVSPAYCRFSRPNIRFKVAVPSNQNFISLTNASIRGTNPNKGSSGFGFAPRFLVDIPEAEYTNPTCANVKKGGRGTRPPTAPIVEEARLVRGNLDMAKGSPKILLKKL